MNRIFFAAAIVLTILLSAPGGPAIAALPLKQGMPTLAPLLKEITPGVVNISVQNKVRVQEQNPLLRDPFFRRFFDVPEVPRERRSQAAGSGVIIDAAKGHVITNHHVIDGADEIFVILKDGRRLKAQLTGSDEATDIALLTIAPDNLTAVEMGDSDALEVGDFVVAIGNPFGLGQTVTSGIVSALGRSGLSIHGYEDFIQTDASINPGNSGGALVNLNGDLIGINTAIIAPSGGNVGIGFAVPINMARRVVDQLLEYGEVRRGRLGVSIQDVTPDLSEALDLKGAKGAVVTQVEKNSSADEAGLRPGDVIVAIDGRAIEDSNDLRNTIGLLGVGSEVELTYYRDGSRNTLRAKIGAIHRAAARGEEAVPALAGAVFKEIDKDSPYYGKLEGVLIEEVAAGSPAWRYGLRRDDVVIGVNRAGISSVDAFVEAARQAEGALLLDVVRNQRRVLIVIS